MTKVNLINDYLISGGADNMIKIRPVGKFMGKETSYKHPGYIQGITQISDSKFLSYCSAGNVIAYDLERHRKFKINDIEMEDEKEN